MCFFFYLFVHDKRRIKTHVMCTLHYVLQPYIGMATDNRLMEQEITTFRRETNDKFMTV